MSDLDWKAVDRATGEAEQQRQNAKPISERLRKPLRAWEGVYRDYPDGRSEGPFHPDMLEAADTIDALVAALDASRKTLWDELYDETHPVLKQIDAALALARKGGG